METRVAFLTSPGFPLTLPPLLRQVPHHVRVVHLLQEEEHSCGARETLDKQGFLSHDMS